MVFWTLYSTMIALIAELGGYRQTMSAPSAAPVSLIGWFLFDSLSRLDYQLTIAGSLPGFAVSLLLGFRTNSACKPSQSFSGRQDS